MSFMTVVPEFVGQAAGQMENIGSALSAAHAAAAAPTTRVVAAAGDEVSAAIASLFSSHAQEYQALNEQAAAFHAQFTNLLNAGAGSYISTEIANTQAAAASGGVAQSIGGSILAALAGSGLQEIELPLDLAGPVIAATGALGQSATAFVNAVQAGNQPAAMAALVNAAPSAGNAFLYGQDTVSIPLPSISGVQSVALDIPFGGVLAPLQPLTVTVTTAGNPPLTVPSGYEVGGIIPDVQANGPEVLLALLLLGFSFV